MKYVCVLLMLAVVVAYVESAAAPPAEIDPVAVAVESVDGKAQGPIDGKTGKIQKRGLYYGWGGPGFYGGGWGWGGWGGWGYPAYGYPAIGYGYGWGGYFY